MKLAALLLAALPAAAHFPDIRVIDGDTINVPAAMVEGMPGRISIRLTGINTPETSSAACDKERAAGEAAKLYLRDRVAGAATLTVTFSRWDKYGGRVAGKVLVDGRDLAADLVAGGYAVPYTGGKRVNAWCNTP